MKAERGEGKFIPIVITLETEEEAKFLWGLLNCPTTALEKALGCKISHCLDGEMLGVLESVYKPKEKDC